VAAHRLCLCVASKTRLGSGLRVIVETISSGECFLVWTEPCDTVLELMCRIQEREGTPIWDQRLFLSGVWLLHVSGTWRGETPLTHTCSTLT
jgi:hypothetical protein